MLKERADGMGEDTEGEHLGQRCCQAGEEEGRKVVGKTSVQVKTAQWCQVWGWQAQGQVGWQKCGDRKKVGESKEEVPQELCQKDVQRRDLNGNMEGSRE